MVMEIYYKDVLAGWWPKQLQTPNQVYR